MKNEANVSKEEKEILDSFENGEWEPVSDKESELNRYSRYARETLKKDKRINIRITERDLESIQNIAIEEGIPYQTLISSLIHKFVTGKITDKIKVS